MVKIDFRHVPHSDDVVEFTIRCAQAVAKIDEGHAKAVDRHVRDLFGKSTVYIAQRRGEGTSARNTAIRLRFASGDHVQLLARRHDLSERQIWRILKGED